MLDLDRSGVGGTLRNQLAVTLDALRRYGGRSLASAVPGDFLLDTLRRAGAVPRSSSASRFFDKVATQRAQARGRPAASARILLLAYMLATHRRETRRTHGVRATADTIADLLIDDLADAAGVRAKLPGLLSALAADGLLIDVGGGEWRLQSKESAEWQAAFNKAQAEEGSDINATARHRADLLRPALDEALAGAVRVPHGASKTSRAIDRVAGAAKAEGTGLTLRLWNEWEHGTTPLNEIKAADVAKDATLHILVPIHRNAELSNAIVAQRAAALVLQRQGIPTTEGGREAKAAMDAKLAAGQKAARTILAEAVAEAKVMVAGGAEIGAGQTRAEAVQAAASRVLDRLYPAVRHRPTTPPGAPPLAKAKARVRRTP